MNLKLKDNPNIKRIGYIQQLEYIVFSGTQYIDTEIPIKDIGIEIKCNLSSRQSYSTILGRESSPYNCSLQFSDNNKLLIYLAKSPNNIRITSPSDFVFNSDHTIYCTTSKTNFSLKIDDTVIGDTTHNISMSDELSAYLGGAAVNNTYIIGKVYYAKIYTGSNLVRYLVPAKDENNTICFYDVISGSFFYNKGSGNFSCGSAIGIVPYLIGDDLSEKITTLFIKDCPALNSYKVLKSIVDSQNNISNLILNRIRVDIGNVSGSLSELMQYSTFAGFNDAYEPQTKPRLVGTWTINNWYDNSMLISAEDTFDGITIIDNTEIEYEYLDTNIIRLLSTSVPTIPPNFITSDISKIYIGIGEDSDYDSSLKNSFASNANWSSYSSKLDTYYNYLHPTT